MVAYCSELGHLLDLRNEVHRIGIKEDDNLQVVVVKDPLPVGQAGRPAASAAEAPRCTSN